MKTFVCIAAIVATAHAGVVGVVSTGASSQHRSEDGLGNYAFGYDEGHATGGTFRKESGSHGVKIGSYGLRDADGRIRTVNYVADALGFRAQVSTNEPGTAPSLPAAAAYNTAPITKVAVAATPVVAAASYAAPVAVASPTLTAPALSYAAGSIGAPLAAPAFSYNAGPIAAPVLAKAALATPAIPAQYAANVFAPSGTPYAW
ncbi:cuticle protein 16.8-like [Tropilaelaps mercedesae]|uniref:Cuticle protein 16.8-like n=1 Tax=Tropilaelaps mercedesae TaxID=418985 RepID=A0A1V9Y0Y8_9ACAR|nr:cuticle protein 16.8-like [Tropilaelaps mercedesae]